MAETFLEAVAVTPRVQAMYDEDMAEDGYVGNSTRLWAYQPQTLEHLSDLMTEALQPSGLTLRQRGILITAAASTLGDSCCSLAWGGKLAGAVDAGFAAAVLAGHDTGLTEREATLAAWDRQVAKDPNATIARDVQQLRDVGFSDPQIFSITLYISLRLAFSTVNDALGVHPEPQLLAALPPEVTTTVNYGRAPQN